ncbi:MAG: alpha-L-fucosidase [Chitinophagaceae bacterium]
MKKRFITFALGLISLGTWAQVAPAPYGALPSARQLKWHETEVYGLIHFTPTTFENKEWGYGDADPSIFNPILFNADSIVAAMKAGGLKGLVLVAKHHDGFALWPTKTTRYNISRSPFREGKGDMVKEFEQACRKAGIKFGVYCSPWDRNHPDYGTYEYVKAYREQLRELYTHYGELFMSWHDGANGGDGYYGGARTTRKIDRNTYYAWDTTWQITRSLQPMANLFSDIGWDVRWVGNESGYADERSWATFTPTPASGESKAFPGNLQHEFNPMGTKGGANWVPAECDVPLRKGWFWHPEQATQVKSPEQLFQLYLKSVGRGAALDLGLAPNTSGRLSPEDIESLIGFGQLVGKTFDKNLMNSATVSASNERGNNFSVTSLIDGSNSTYWASEDAVHRADFLIEWQEPQSIDFIRLREYIPLGQRIENVRVDQWNGNFWEPLASASTVGACRIIAMEKTLHSKKIRVSIEAPVTLTLSELGCYTKFKPSPKSNLP